MSQPTRAKVARLAGAVALGASLLAPSAVPAIAVEGGEPVVLRVATTQDLDASNPFNTELVVGYEAFQLTYDLLVNFDKDAKPGPGFADTWERSPDRVTFHIRENMKWSDGEVADSADACFSWGLAMNAIDADSYIGAGYLDPGLSEAGVTKVECPDANTFVAYTTDQSERIFQAYVPILPEHVWGEETYETIAEETFDPPLVGTGPYTMVEWQTGQFARFIRNPNYWGQQGFADEVVLQFFPDATDTMVQALKSGDLDYIHNANPDQFKQFQADPAFTAVEGQANGWTQIAFNTYGTGTGKTIEGGGPSTKALLDQKFRDALGYAIDKDALVERVIGGLRGRRHDQHPADPRRTGTSSPTTPRSFDIDLAKQKLEDAGYPLNGDGKRLDKEGKPIALRVIYPNTHDIYAKSAQFVQEWYGLLGIDVSLQSLDSDTVTNPCCRRRATRPARPTTTSRSGAGPGARTRATCCRSSSATRSAISSDSQYCNPAYDELYEKQLTQAGAERKATLTQMQNLIYDEAPYDILFYDSYLDVYRNDRFAGWQNMPADGGIPFFTYGILNYTLLTDATAQPSPTAGAGVALARRLGGARARPPPTPRRRPPATAGRRPATAATTRR